MGATLASMAIGVPFEPELLLPCGYSIDIAVPAHRLAIEVDGPTHFLSFGEGRLRHPTGNTMIKRRSIQALGWRPEIDLNSALPLARPRPELKKMKGDTYDL